MNTPSFRTTVLLPALLVLSIIDARAAEAPADGLYLAARSAPAEELHTQDGRTVFLGARRDLQVLGGQIKSKGNDNASFWLYLTIPYDASIPPDGYILVVAGTVYRQQGSGSDNHKTSQLDFGISGDEHAREVSRHFTIPVTNFHHPGYRLRVSFTPAGKSFTRGDDVKVTLRIVNVGTEPVAFVKGGRYGNSRDNQYVFSAYKDGKSAPDIGSSLMLADQLSTRELLPPGAGFEETVDLGKWFEFKDAGLYEIHGSYCLSFLEPVGYSHDVIWTDYASADFTVRIN